MKKAIRRAIWKVIGHPAVLSPRHWERPLDAVGERRQALDMAIANLEISTRNEPLDESSAHSLRGDYLEFGVFQGDTFAHVCQRAIDRLRGMRFFALDSFAGLPQVRGSDAEGEFSTGQFACSLPEFQKNLLHSGVDMKRVIAVPGWFDQTLTESLKQQHSISIASLAYIDCDLYESCVPALNFLTSLVRQGSFLFFDDWYCFRNDPNRGVQRATREWLSQNPSISLTDWHSFSHHGKAFIVNRVH
jgi:hypothetical protein